MSTPHKNNSLSVRAALRLLQIYQKCISPVIGGRNACRFMPSCSEYTKQAIIKYGALRGIYMGFRRIMRCRPGGGCGYDPVP